MRHNQTLKVWGAAFAALFSVSTPSFSGEWDAYQDLKAAIVHSSAKRDRPLPSWLQVKPFQPYPHYYLDDKNAKPAPVLTVAVPAPKTDDAPCPSGVTCSGVASIGAAK
jgi:hypothetical protein